MRFTSSDSQLIRRFYDGDSSNDDGRAKMLCANALGVTGGTVERSEFSTSYSRRLVAGRIQPS